MTMRKCFTCRHFHENVETYQESLPVNVDWGECRKNPPVIVREMTGDPSRGMWPVVSPTAGCGGWEVDE